MTNTMNFTLSDAIAGYVICYDEEKDFFVLRTTDGREYTVDLTPNTFGRVIRNLGEDYQDVTGQLADMLYPGCYLYAYGIYYPEGDGHRFEVKEIVFPGMPGRAVPVRRSRLVDQPGPGGGQLLSARPVPRRQV
jgi:hypothetical protein